MLSLKKKQKKKLEVYFFVSVHMKTNITKWLILV